MENIFSSLCGFVLDNKEAIFSSVIASGGYDILKNILNFSSLSERISRFFKNDIQAETFLKEICSEPPQNPNKIHRDIEDCFEAISGTCYDKKLYTEIEQWIKENREQIINAPSFEQKNESGINIGVQSAGRDIFNIQGDYNN